MSNAYATAPSILDASRVHENTPLLIEHIKCSDSKNILDSSGTTDIFSSGPVAYPTESSLRLLACKFNALYPFLRVKNPSSLSQLLFQYRVRLYPGFRVRLLFVAFSDVFSNISILFCFLPLCYDFFKDKIWELL